MKECSGCQETLNKPYITQYSTLVDITQHKPWQRVHVDFAGLYLGQMLLVTMDAYSR